MELQDLNLINYAIPGFVILIIIEVILTWRMQKENYTFKDSAASISMGLGNVAIGGLVKVMTLAIFFFFYQYRLFEIPVTIWSWIALFLLEDFTYYWNHRIAHRSRFFWASHVVHHSSQHYNLSTALRQTWTGPLYTFVFWLWLPVLGFNPYMIFAQMAISLIYQFWIHTEVIDRMPSWFEAVFNTPSHHRVHHATNPIYLDRNHAGILIIWDKLFGTFEPEVEEQDPEYGLTTNIDTYNPIYIAFHVWRDMMKDVFQKGIGLKDRIAYLIKPPGWKHDGTGQLSEDMRREWENSNS